MPRRTKVAWLILLPMNSSNTSPWASNWIRPTGRVLRDRAQHRQRHGVVAADRHRCGARAWIALEESLDQRDAAHHVQRVGRRIADVGDLAELEGCDPGRRVDLADQARGLAHRGRPMARADPVGGAEIERHADQRDLERRGDLGPRRAHEGRDLLIAGHEAGMERLELAFA